MTGLCFLTAFAVLCAVSGEFQTETGSTSAALNVPGVLSPELPPVPIPDATPLPDSILDSIPDSIPEEDVAEAAVDAAVEATEETKQGPETTPDAPYEHSEASDISGDETPTANINYTDVTLDDLVI